jgi:hypothetical protein
MMTPEQFEQTLQALLDRKPFRPFGVVLLNGDRFEVDDPQYVSRSHDGAAGFIDAAERPWMFDIETVVEFIADPAGVPS